MGKVDLDALSHVLEHLQTAHHEVQSAVPELSKCGSMSLLSGQMAEVRERLRDLSEIAAALLDSKLTEED